MVRAAAALSVAMLAVMTASRACGLLHAPFRSLGRTVLPATAIGRQLHIPTAPPPLKAMIFVDGTWLYYSLVAGRGTAKKDPVQQRLGDQWQAKYVIDWPMFPRIIADAISEQLKQAHSLRTDVEVARTCVFTSLRADTAPNDPREQLVADFTRSNFDVNRLVTRMSQEKCVDISLAVEMLYMSTVPHAFDIAVLVSGDKDFLPALRKTRLLGKQVAVCSMRNSCNADLASANSATKDFGMIWLDDYITQLYVSRLGGLVDNTQQLEMEVKVLQLCVDILKSNPSPFSSRELGRALQAAKLPSGIPALTGLKTAYSSLTNFLEHHEQFFEIVRERAFDVHSSETFDFGVALSPRAPSIVTLSQLEAQAGSADGHNGGSELELTNDNLRMMVLEILAKNNFSMTSRELGRAMQTRRLGSSTLLGLVKTRFSMLRLFFEHYGSTFQTSKRNSNEEGFLVSVSSSHGVPRDAPSSAAASPEVPVPTPAPARDSQKSQVTNKQTVAGGVEFNEWTVKQLQSALREAGLPVSGLKAVLVDRLAQSRNL